MLKLLAAGITLFGLMALAAALTTTTARPTSPRTPATSLLPPP